MITEFIVATMNAQKDEIERLQAAIRRHRDQRGDDRCWMDDEALYAVLPEGFTPPERDTRVELERCEKYIECRRNPRTVYVSPQRRIEELEAEVARLRAAAEDVLTTYENDGMLGGPMQHLRKAWLAARAKE